MKRFSFPAFYAGEVMALLPTEEAARKFEEALHAGGAPMELEVVPPPPPATIFIGESGIPRELFESGDSSLSSGVEWVELKGLDHYVKLMEDHVVVGKQQVGGKNFLSIRKKS